MLQCNERGVLVFGPWGAPIQTTYGTGYQHLMVAVLQTSETEHLRKAGAGCSHRRLQWPVTGSWLCC